MKPLFLTTIRSGMLAVGVVSGLSAPSMAGPIQPDVPLPTAAAAREIVPVREGWAGGNNNVWMRGRNFSGARNWNRRNWNGGNWNRGNWNRRNWNRGNWNRGNWNGGRRWYGGGYYGRYYDDDDDSAAAAILGLGLGFGLGSLYQGYYNQGYYNPGYYNNGYYAPRRYYRTLSNAHVRWCYNRYRSYRTWDNTFQPYNGPRRQCWSPYR